MTSSLTSPPNSPDAARLGLPDLAFVGKAGAGKSSAAELLTSTLGYKGRSFAGPLKQTAATLWGESARTDRDKLQRLGVAVRDIEPDTWVILFQHSLVSGDANFGYIGPRPPCVCDDLRFENEWFALKARGFVIVRVEADTATRVARLKANGKWQDESQLEHESETAVDHLVADHTVTNNDSPEEFNDRIIDIVIKERARR